MPIIHTEADLGSLAPGIEQATASLCGEERWAEHREAVAGFWRAIEDYLASLDAAGLKIYQDGLAAEGDLGRRVIEEGVRRGSRNYQIVLGLMNRGAEIRTTEDASLLLEEYHQIAGLAGEGPQARVGGVAEERTTGEGASRYAAYELRKEILTKKRDRFIAARVNDSLKDGETAVLFIGAYHDVGSHLAKDIVVRALKEPEKVRAYFQELLAGRDSDGFRQRTDYLVAPVEGSEGRAAGP